MLAFLVLVQFHLEDVVVLFEATGTFKLGLDVTHHAQQVVVFGLQPFVFDGQVAQIGGSVLLIHELVNDLLVLDTILLKLLS